MSASLVCPTCEEDLISDGQSFTCAEGHHYTALGLALANNIAALRALWAAIRALEDDAAGLRYLAGAYGDEHGQPATARREEAEAALEAAAVLRVHAERAQQRLDALPVPAAAALRTPDLPDRPNDRA